MTDDIKSRKTSLLSPPFAYILGSSGFVLEGNASGSAKEGELRTRNAEALVTHGVTP